MSDDHNIEMNNEFRQERQERLREINRKFKTLAPADVIDVIDVIDENERLKSELTTARDEAEKLKALIAELESMKPEVVIIDATGEPARSTGKLVGWMNHRGDFIPVKTKDSLVNSQGIVGAATATNFGTPVYVQDYLTGVPQPADYPDAYCVIEQDGKIGYTVTVDQFNPNGQADEIARNFCHEHINECCANGIEGAGMWVVRPLTVGSCKPPHSDGKGASDE